MLESPFSEVSQRYVVEVSDQLNSFLAQVVGLDDSERNCISGSAFRALHSEAHLALIRVLVLELHAAKVTGMLTDGSPEMQFQEFLRSALEPAFITHLRSRYPVLEKWLARSLDNRRTAIESMVSRMVADREKLRDYFGTNCDRLTGLELGVGDSHDGGCAVAKLEFSGGLLMYKPRPMALDVCLEAFLEHVFPSQEERVRVPKTLDRGDYGWAAFVEHRYCRDDAELVQFYRSMGCWIGVMHLLGGTDIHCDNLIASGPVPLVVDPECLFVPFEGAIESGRGPAHNEAVRTIGDSVLRTSIVPRRLPHVAFRGVDISSLGASAGQKGKTLAPMLVDDGTIDVRIIGGEVTFDTPMSLPGPEPSFVKHSEEIVSGYLQTTRRLCDLDSRGQLFSMLGAFEGSRVREMFRPTQTYVELKHLLWHPASLHDPTKARARVMDALRHGARARTLTPDHLDRELNDLQARDIPAFRRRVSIDHVASLLRRWRADRPEMQEMILRSSLFAANLNARHDDQNGGHIDRVPGCADDSICDHHDALRRRLARQSMQRLLKYAVTAANGSVTWLGMALSTNGWSVEPIKADLYGGLSGVAFALAGYRHEMACGRVDHIDGLQDALDGCMATIHAVDHLPESARRRGFIGEGGRIWSWLLLYLLLDEPRMLEFAIERAESLLVDDFTGNGEYDLLGGEAGLIVPLLHLGALTYDVRWLDLAGTIGRQLVASAIVDERGARWVSAASEEPIGGFAHGSTGVGWALARLSISSAGSAKERERWNQIADLAFRFEMSLYDDNHCAWRDMRLREPGAFSNAWCHGGIGIGLAAADLYARTKRDAYLQTMRTAVASALKHGWHQGVSLCHGSLALRELVFRSNEVDDQLDRSVLDRGDLVIMSEMGRFLSNERSDAMELFVPGLMTGLSGVIFGLCRMSSKCTLPTPLLMDAECGHISKRHTRSNRSTVS